MKPQQGFIAELEGLRACMLDPSDLKNLPIINGVALGNYDIWCPGCARNRKMSFKGIWVNDDGKYVCTYGVCESCASAQQEASEEEATKRIDLVEARLLARYPNQLLHLT